MLLVSQLSMQLLHPLIDQFRLTILDGDCKQKNFFCLNNELYTHHGRSGSLNLSKNTLNQLLSFNLRLFIYPDCNYIKSYEVLCVLQGKPGAVEYELV